MTRDGGTWWLEDLGSKNGTRLDGASVARAQLRDGAIIEVGQTHLRFRQQLPWCARPDVDSDALSIEPPGFATLLPDLGARLNELRTLATRPGPVAFLGETGTGKDVTARSYHQFTGRQGRFVPVNCGAIPESLVEATLFGHRRGAFSGAVDEQPGLVREAHGGTLFLDEIGDLPMSSQATLLRVLETGEVYPVGGSRPMKIDLRIVSATHRDIHEMVRSGRFRADLWARLAAHVLRLPPLRERREDIGLLVAAALRRHAGELASAISFHRETAWQLLNYPFPLNVRELLNAIGRAIALANGEVITPEHLSLPSASVGDDARQPAGCSAHNERFRQSAPGTPLNWPARMRRPPPSPGEIQRLLFTYGGNVTEVARALGRSRPLVHRWMRRLGLKAENFRGK